MNKHGVSMVFALIASLFSACANGGDQIDKGVALEMVQVLRYGKRPTLSPIQLSRGGHQIEDYRAVVSEKIFADANADLRSMLADSYLSWGQTGYAWALIRSRPGSQGPAPSNLDLRVAVATIFGASELNSIVRDIPTGEITTLVSAKALEELVGGNSGSAETELSALDPMKGGRLTSTEFARRWLWYAAFVERAAIAHCRVARQPDKQIQFSEIALRCFLEGNSWDEYVRNRRAQAETRLQTLCFQDIVWVMAGIDRVCRDAGNEAAARVWEARLDDLESLLRAEKDRWADWIRFVRSDGFGSNRK